MKTERLSAGIRVVLLVCGLLLIPVLFKPIWRIELDAPQYPEGLMMNISARGLGGDVDIINGLNHYIGMKTLHNEDFIEFKILPYIITAFIGFFIFVSLMGKRRPMRVLLVSLILFGALAMIDFWKWEYDYGHNLDPTAAIIVPGQAYQPPLIGFKQLLNFGAYSIPDIGGWLFISVGLILLTCVIIDYYKIKKTNKRHAKKAVLAIIGIGMITTFSGCNAEPQAIKFGSDNCHYCKMTISDHKFGAEILTKKGKVYKYDELHCLMAELSEKNIELSSVKDFYFTDYSNDHALVRGPEGFYLKSDKIKGPMGGNIAVFSNREKLQEVRNELGGEEINWNELIPSR